MKIKGVDLQHYADLLIKRYGSPALRHHTWQIAMDGNQKLPQHMLDSTRWYIVHGSGFALLALGIADQIRYVGGMDEQGQTIEINNPLLPVIRNAVCSSSEGEGRTQALLTIDTIFGYELPQAGPFNQQVTQAYLTLPAKGVKVMVAKHAAKLK